MSTSSIGTRVDNLEASRTKMRATIKKQAQDLESCVARISELEEKLKTVTEVLDDVQTRVYDLNTEPSKSKILELVQAQPKTETEPVKPNTKTSLGSGLMMVSRTWILPLVVATVFLLAGLGIYGGKPEPKYFVGMSESGAKIAMFETTKDSAESVASKIFWKHGDTRIDPKSGKTLVLNTQNWQVLPDQVQTPPVVSRSRKPAPTPEQVNGNVTAHEEKNSGTEIDLTK